MKNLKLFLIVLVLALCQFSTSNGQHFYASGNAVPLFVDSSKLVIKFDDELSQYNQLGILSSIPRLDSTIIDKHAIDYFFYLFSIYRSGLL